MNSIARQKSAIPINSDCGNVITAINVWAICHRSVADGTRVVLESLSPLGPQETSGYRHRLGGGVGDWLLTNEFTRWDESGDRTPSLSCFVVGTLAMGDLRAMCILGIDCGYP